MCAGCAVTAAAGATGARAFLQAHGLLGRRGLKVATIALCAGALGVSTVGLSGSGASPAGAQQPAPSAAAQPTR